MYTGFISRQTRNSVRETSWSGIAPQRYALAVNVLVHVGDHVEQASAFVGDDVGHLHAGHDAHRLDEAIRCLQANRQLQHLVG